MSSTSETPDQEIIQGDCIDEMQAMDADSVHAVVCDPPYGLAFMGRTWDQFEPKEYQEWCEQWASEALRVLKPGGHLIAFSGNRTHHRLFSAVEDAGFEIRDTLTYHYGTGFPKGSDVGKHIDRYYDAEDEREVVDTVDQTRGDAPTPETHDRGDIEPAGDIDNVYEVTAPATSEAEQWDGWRSQLKPATEFAVLARAPMSESAVYRNVLEHGTGALNIDRTRIPVSDEEGDRKTEPAGFLRRGRTDEEIFGEVDSGREEGSKYKTTEGRYPANLLLDRHTARMLDEQSGECPTGKGAGPSFSDGDKNSHDGWRRDAHAGYENTPDAGYGDTGGASRFFYTAKASKSERSIDGQIDNEHPTVKPLDLMEWLVTLVTAPGQRVLDPFAGSGTTIMACKRLGREGIGIEKDAEHADLARKRVELAHELETERVPATDADADADDTDGPATLESFADADDD